MCVLKFYLSFQVGRFGPTLGWPKCRNRFVSGFGTLSKALAASIFLIALGTVWPENYKTGQRTRGDVRLWYEIRKRDRVIVTQQRKVYYWLLSDQRKVSIVSSSWKSKRSYTLFLGMPVIILEIPIRTQAEGRIFCLDSCSSLPLLNYSTSPSRRMPVPYDTS